MARNTELHHQIQSNDITIQNVLDSIGTLSSIIQSRNALHNTSGNNAARLEERAHQIANQQRGLTIEGESQIDAFFNDVMKKMGFEHTVMEAKIKSISSDLNKCITTSKNYSLELLDPYYYRNILELLEQLIIISFKVTTLINNSPDRNSLGFVRHHDFMQQIASEIVFLRKQLLIRMLEECLKEYEESPNQDYSQYPKFFQQPIKQLMRQTHIIDKEKNLVIDLREQFGSWLDNPAKSDLDILNYVDTRNELLPPSCRHFGVLYPSLKNTINEMKNIIGQFPENNAQSQTHHSLAVQLSA